MNSSDPKSPNKGATNDELIGLLRELGSSKDTELLHRVASGKTRAPLEWPPAPREIDRSTINLKKHLVAIHREELASLLTDACFRLLVTDKKVGGMVLLDQVDGAPVEPQPYGDWKRRTMHKRATFSDPSGSEAEMLVLDRLVAPALGGAPSLREVADAGLKLAPSTALEIYRGYGLEVEGDLRGAAKVLEVAHSESWSYTSGLASACALGHVALAAGDPQGAVGWYKRASTGREPCPWGALGWVLGSIQAGHRGELQNAARELCNHLGAAHAPLFDSYIARLRADFLSGNWKPTEAALSLSKMTWNEDHVQRMFKLFC